MSDSTDLAPPPSPHTPAAAVPEEGARFAPARVRAVTAALVLVTALAALESTVVSTAMPTIIGDLRGLSVYSWVFSAYLLSATVTMPIYGRMADLYGRRRVLLAAIALFVAGAGACAAAQTMTHLIVARVLQGLGAGGLMPVALIVVADLFPLRERARVQGLFSGIWGVASLAGPILGAALTVTFGWRSIFSINLPLGVLAFVLVATLMIESRAPRPDPLDVGGALLLAGGITAILLSVVQRAGAAALPLAGRAALLAGGVVALVLFVREQARREHPLIPPGLFRHARTVAPYAGGALMGTAVFGVDTFVPLFVQGARGGTAMSAGAVVTPVMLLWALSAAVAAPAVVRFGFRRTAQIGASLVLLGFCALLACVFRHASVGPIIAACALIGAGLGPSSMAQVLAIQHAADERQRGVATSLVPFFRAVGGALGVAVLGALLAAGLSARLGPAADAAGELLAHGPARPAIPGLDPHILRTALESALLPVFAVLAALSVLNLVVASSFPRHVEG
jgi:EmrB/QacA subfamily drug resistance transporter